MQLDAFFLANGAEVRDGLLFALAGGWTRTWPAKGYPFDKDFTFAALVRVDWTETNEQHSFMVELRDDDEEPLSETPVQGGFVVGKPAQLAQGASQCFPLSATFTASIPKPGLYHLVLHIDGTEMHRIQFEAAPPKSAKG